MDFRPNEKPEYGQLGQRLRTVRKALGLGLRDLSGLTNISVSNLSKIETGKISPTIPALVRISSAVGRPLAFFFQSQAEIPTSLATLVPLVGPEGDSVSSFAARVQERSRGQMRLQILPAAGLDRFAEIPDVLLSGAIDIVVEGLAFYQAYADALIPASLPFCFRNFEHYRSFLQGDLFRENVIDVLRNRGVRFLDPGWAWRRVPRVLVSTRPVFTVADLVGARFRVYDSEPMRKFWERFGAKATFVPWLETRRAFEEGSIDCALVSAGFLHTMRFTERAKYVTVLGLCDAMISTVNVAMSEKCYQLLAPETQEILSTAAAEVAAEATQCLVQLSADGVAKCVSEQNAVISTINLQPFHDRAAEIIRDLEREGCWQEGLFGAIQRLGPL